MNIKDTNNKKMVNSPLTPEEVRDGLRKTVSSLIADENIRKLYEQTNDMIDLKDILDDILSYQKELSLIPKNQLSNIQNIWLLAYEASQSRLAKMASDKTEESKMQFADSLDILNDFIKKHKTK